MAVATLIRSLTHFDRANWRPRSATRCALGLAIPAIGATLAGHPAWGVLAGLGALYAGMASFRGAFRTRIELMLQVSAAIAVVTFLGGLLSRFPWLIIVSITLACVPLALFSLRGRSANTLAIQATGTLIVLSGIPQSPAEALASALLVFAGAMFQILLLAIVWPFDRHFPERMAVADVFSGLADYVDELRDEPGLLLPDVGPFSEAQEVLGPILERRRTEERALLMHALQGAEAIRAALVPFARSHEALCKEGEDADTHADAVAADLELTLRNIADMVRSGKQLNTMEIGVGVFSSSTSEPIDIHPPNQARDAWQEHRQWSELLRQEIMELGQPSHECEERTSGSTRRNRSLWRRIVCAITRIPDELTFESLSLQHALRYALVVGLASAIGQLTRMSHGYWLPLTVAIIHRPDYATTLQRGLGRLVGTLAGVILATLISIEIHPNPTLGAILMLIAAWLSLALFLANYAVYAAAITLYVVFSISTAGAEEATAILRLEATFIGVLLAISAYFVWPIWQSRQVWKVLQDAVQAQIAYGEMLVGMLDGEIETIPDQIRQRTRNLRVQAETLVEAAEIEPRWTRGPELKLAAEAVRKIEENAAVLLSLRAEALQDLRRDYGSDHTRKKIHAVLSDIRRLADRLERQPEETSTAPSTASP